MKGTSNLDRAITKLVKYRVKKKKLAKIKKEVSQYLESVKKNEPDTILYDIFQEKDDPASFVHIMSFKDKRAERVHAKSQHLQKLVKTLYPSCKQEPEFTELVPLKSTKSPQRTTQTEKVPPES